VRHPFAFDPGKDKINEGKDEQVDEQPKYEQDFLSRSVGMQGASRVFSFGIGFREIVLAQGLFSDAQDCMRCANGGPTGGGMRAKEAK